MIYITLKNAFAAKIQQIESIKTFDWFNEQYVNTETEEVQSYPAVYFEIIEPVYWNQAGDKMQHARIRTRLHVVTDELKNNPELCMTIAQELTLNLNGSIFYEEILNEANEVIEQRNFTTALFRAATSFPKRYRMLKVMMIDFDFEVTDLTLMDPTVPVNANFRITLS